ncbi:MAG: FIST C-terminal domain-containing protein [Spirochaetales bacterium]|nr:FIST C-terminal domain-containing protein [Spirochaetales bacterium]
MLIKIGPDGILEDKTMKLLNCVYETDTDLQAFITASDLAREANLLVQIFSGSTDRQKLRNLLSLLARELPQAAVIGASTSGELLECDYRTDSIVVSFACFQKVRVRSLLVPEGYGDMRQAGRKIRNELVEADTRLLIVFSHGTYTDNYDPATLLQVISEGRPDLIIAGGAAGKYWETLQDGTVAFQLQTGSTFVLGGTKFSQNTVVAAAISGEGLTITVDRNLGWKTIGKKMTVTRAEMQGTFCRVYSIDGIPPLDLYRKYFGDRFADGLPGSAVEFSFVLERGGLELDVIPGTVYPDGSILYSTAMAEGETIRFGFGDPAIVLEESAHSARRIAEADPEGLFIYSCATRIRQLSHVTQNELNAFKSIAPSAGFFTFTEFYHFNGRNHTLGKTMTLLGLSESERKEPGQLSFAADQENQRTADALLGIYTMIQTMTRELEEAEQQSNKLLLNILPESVAETLKQGRQVIADHFENVSILFADIVGFSRLAGDIAPEALIQLLNTLFSGFDALAEKYHLEKIKTIGDAYFVAGGVPLADETHLRKICSFALEMVNFINEYRKNESSDLNIRVGIHCGPVIAGVLGTRKFSYDLWGDTVNIASRMESHGLPGHVQVTETVKNQLTDLFLFQERGLIDIKGKGVMRTYFLTGHADP